MDYYNKYIKYKQKYLKLKNQDGGVLPFITLDDENKTNDYFPFDNNKFNYYFNDHLLIFNDEHNEDYLLNEKFELDKLVLNSKQKSDFLKKNIINNNNIYKLADEQIIISSDINFPFHLCLLSKYKILDELYLKHINIDTKEINYEYLQLQKKENNEKIKKLKIQSIILFKLKRNFKNTFLKNNVKTVFINIFNFTETNRIFDITYNYNILLKYSYCNKFLELLKLIYDIQLKIDYINLDILTTDAKPANQNNFNNIFILFDNKYNLEDYIAINIINFFISSTSKSDLKDNFIIIDLFYKEEQLKIEEEQLKIEEEKEKLSKTIKEEELSETIEEQLKTIKKELKTRQQELDIIKDTNETNKVKDMRDLKKKLKIKEKKLEIIKKKSIIEKKKLIIEEKKSIIEKKKSIIEEEKKEQLEIDYNDAIQTYINISDTTLLFKNMFENQNKENIIKKLIPNLKELKDLKDLKGLKDHLEDDIKNIKQLLFFNLYVDNNILLSPKFSYIFYATFIFYRLNKPLITYESFDNLYPINKNNFICNLIGINNFSLYLLINKSDNELSINKKMFMYNLKYIKHPIHSFGGFKIKTKSEEYINCLENGILEFLKILFWDQKKFKINLPEENKETETLKLLLDIFNDINKNLNNITSFYDSKEYNQKIHKLFSGHDNIVYIKYNDKNKYEIKSSMENFYEMLRIILNFDTIDELKEYFNSINTYNSNIIKIIKTDMTIEICIENYKLYTITIETSHTYLTSFDNIHINILKEYDYFYLLLYYTDIISILDEKQLTRFIFYNYIPLYEQNDKNLKYYEYLIKLFIIKKPEKIFLIDDTHPTYPDETLRTFPNNINIKIIMYLYNKVPSILPLIKLTSVNQDIIYNTILNNLDENDKKYKDIVECILYKNPKFIKDIPIDHNDFSEIVINSINVYVYENENYCDIVDYLIEKYPEYINILLNTIKQDHTNYKVLVIYILSIRPEFINKIPLDRDDFAEIVINSIYVNVYENNCEIVDFLYKKHPNYIDILFKQINKDYIKHQKYKDLVIYLIGLRPDLINQIDSNNEYLPDIIINNFKNIGKINNEIVNYVKNLNFSILNNIFIIINLNYSNHPNYKDFIMYIISLDHKFIKDIPIDHKDYEKILKYYNIIKK